MNSAAMTLAFPVSDELRLHLDAFLEAPGEQVHLVPLLDSFLSDLMAAFFDGPIQAVGAQGSVATMVQGGVKVISKAARALIRSLIGKAGPAEREALADHFRTLALVQGNELRIRLPMSEARTTEIQRVFAAYLSGASGYSVQLVAVMRELCDDALAQYFDALVACVRLNAFSRGVVATARKTIQKAAYMAVEKGLPALGRAHKEPVVRHFDGMLQPA